MGRVSQAVKDLRQLRLPEDIGSVLDEPRFWTPACFKAFLKLCDETIFEDPQRGLAMARAAPRFARRLSKGSSSLKMARGDRHRAQALAVLGSAHRVTGNPGEAARAYDEALEIGRQGSFEEHEMTDLYCRLAMLKLVQERREEGLELVTKAIEIERVQTSEGRREALCAALVIRGIIQSREDPMGKACHSGALQDLMEALSLCHPRRSSRVFYSAVHNLALVVLEGTHRAEDLDAALRRVNEAQKLLRRYRVRRRSVADAKLRWIRALILSRFGSTQRAEQLLMDAREDLMQLDMAVEVFLISFDLADLYLAEGRYGTLKMLAREVMGLETAGCSHETIAALLLWHKAIREERLTAEISRLVRHQMGYRNGPYPPGRASRRSP